MKIDNSFGFSFPPMFIAFGGFTVIISLVLLGNSIDQFSLNEKDSMQNGYILFGAFLFCFWFGLTFLTSKEGVEIRITEKKYRNYTTFIGIKKGKWKPYGKYTQLCILGKTNTYSMSSRANISTKFKSNGFNIYLLNDNHLRKLLIYSTKHKKLAELKMKELSDHLNIPIVKFNPKRIQKRR